MSGRLEAAWWASLLGLILAVAMPPELGAQAFDRRSRIPPGTAAAAVDPSLIPQVPPTGPAPISTALAGPIDPNRYLLGPGDVLLLEYTGRADRSQELIVDGEGRFRVPNLGSISVAGRPLQEVRDQIIRDLKPFVPGATIDLRIVQLRTFKVYVVGAVSEPGIAEVRGSARVIEAIDAVGGLGDRGSRRNIRILHSDGTEEIADLERFVWTGDIEANPYLRDGDRVVVPNQTRDVLVSGAIARSGSIEYRDGDTLLGLLEIAGGLLSQARLDSVLVIRFDGDRDLDTLVVDLDAVLAGSLSDIAIGEDDRIFVRSISQWHPEHQVNVVGEVMYPGLYAVVEGRDRISDILGAAGGFTPNASVKAVRILRRPDIEGEDVEFDRLSRLTRAEMTDSEYQTFRGKLAIRQSAYLVDFSQGVASPPESDVLLRSGDIIEVERLELAVRVDGSVQRPGFVAYQTGLSVRDYLALVGGTTSRADMGGLRVTRAGSNETQRANSDWTIEPGDFIWVPEKKDTSFWDTFKDVIAVAGQVAAIVILLDTLSSN